MSNAKKANSGAGKRGAFNYQDGAIQMPLIFFFLLEPQVSMKSGDNCCQL